MLIVTLFHRWSSYKNTTKKLKVYFPPSDSCRDLTDNLRRHGGKPSLLLKNERRFKESIMPDSIEENGRIIEIPQKWLEFRIR